MGGEQSSESILAANVSFQQRWNHSSWTGLSVELVQETRSSAVIILFSVSRTSLMV